MTSSLMPLLAFLLVIALIPVALWMMKRAGVGGAPTGGVLPPQEPPRGRSRRAPANRPVRRNTSFADTGRVDARNSDENPRPKIAAPG